jgi:DNA polymerase III subunit delta'
MARTLDAGRRIGTARVADRGEAGGLAPAPRTNPDLVGHDAVERELLRLYQAARLPHAILFGGPQGIGKATLAFRLARFVLARRTITGGSASGLAIAPESGVFHRIAAGGHADLLTVERLFDPQRRRLRGEIVAEQTREISRFLHLTAGEEGWRVVIVDGAEEMNRSAANALLKILEEPPRRSLFLLVSHSPGLLLPTIRSRCRQFRLGPLPRPLVASLLDRYRPQPDAAQREALSTLSGGSIGHALGLADAGGLALYRGLLEILSQLPRLDICRLRALVDPLLAPDAEGPYRALAELLSQCLARIATTGGRGYYCAVPVVAGEGEAMRRLAGADPARWARLRREIDENFAVAREFNLDRKQAMFGAFFAIAEAAR